MKTITEFPGIKLKDGVMLLKSIIDEKKASKTKAQLEAKLLAKGAQEKERLDAEASKEAPANESQNEASESTTAVSAAEVTATETSGAAESVTAETESTPDVTVQSDESAASTESIDVAQSESTEETVAAAEVSSEESATGEQKAAGSKSEDLKVVRQQEREETTNELRGLLEKSYNLEGEKLEFLLNAVLTVDRRRLADIRRVVVLQLEEGEAEPKGVQKRGEHFYRAEYLPPLKKDKKRFSKGKGRGNQKRDKRRFDKKRRPRRPNDRDNGQGPGRGDRKSTAATPASGS